MDLNFLDKNIFIFIKTILDVDIEKDIVFIKDENFRYIYANDVFCNLFNIQFEKIVGKNDDTFILNEKVLEKCYQSDLHSFQKDFLIHEEEVNNETFRVLKIKINLGSGRTGILCFAKLQKE